MWEASDGTTVDVGMADLAGLFGLFDASDGAESGADL